MLLDWKEKTFGKKIDWTDSHMENSKSARGVSPNFIVKQF